MAYTTSELTTIIKALEAGLALSYAEVTFEGRRLVYRDTDKILKAIAYFNALLGSATDAPSDAPRKVRTYYMHGGNGIGQ